MNKTRDLLFEEALERTLEARACHFAEDYDAVQKPLLILQCMPACRTEVDVTTPELLAALKDGAVNSRAEAWWHGFRSPYQPAAVFDGVAVTSRVPSEGWATEFHTDGCLIAGVWEFPEPALAGGGTCLALMPFYCDAFTDFGRLASTVYDSICFREPLWVHATLRFANRLYFYSDRAAKISDPVRRHTLRWPVRQIDASALQTTWSVMGKRLWRCLQ